MTLVICYCVDDLPRMLRLFKWMLFLESKNGDSSSLSKATCLLVASCNAGKRAWHKEIVKLAKLIFGKIIVEIRDAEDGRGWPAATNSAVQAGLHFAKQHNLGDIFFLEPDCVPLKKDWWDHMLDQWSIAKKLKKTFMGSMVDNRPGIRPHLTGNAAYGKNWLAVAPKIATAEKEAWDIFAADQILPNAHFIDGLLQHRWRDAFKPEILSQNAVLYHCDKDGKVIEAADQLHFKGECSKHKTFSYLNLPEEPVVMRYFYSTNLSVPTGVSWTAVDMIGGSWRGIFSTQEKSTAEKLEKLVAARPGIVSEITEAEFEEIVKKKLTPQISYPEYQQRQQVVHGIPIRGATAAPADPPSQFVESSEIQGPEIPLHEAKDIENLLKFTLIEERKDPFKSTTVVVPKRRVKT